MKSKSNKLSRNLLIAMLLGDGSISAQNGFKVTHCKKQLDYLEWKITQLNKHGIRNCGVKYYTSAKGYKVGETYYYTRLSTTPFIKVLRRVIYKPNKVIANRKLLNRLDALGLAIWYMDDGNINHRKKVGIYIKISTCISKENNQIIIDYFKDVWNINFYMFSEGRKTYSICCGTKEAIKFIEIIKPYVLQVPSMIYKISYDIRSSTRSVDSSESKRETPLYLIKDEDMIYSSVKAEAGNDELLTTTHEYKV